MVANNITSLLQRVAGTSVQEIDKLISELQTLRDMLQNEGARVQREIVEYATLSQAALQSTKIIAESLTGWKKVPDAPSLRYWCIDSSGAAEIRAPASGPARCFLARVSAAIVFLETPKRKRPRRPEPRGQVEGGNAQRAMVGDLPPSSIARRLLHHRSSRRPPV
jgi:hypothetical protein